MREYYSIDDLATMTMLTTRTLRNYISQGLLEGEKEAGAWRFSDDNIEAFLKEPSVAQSIQSKKNCMVYDFMSDDIKHEDMACTLFDYPNLNRDEAEAIYEKLVNRINSGHYGPIRFSYSYNRRKKMVRIILIGAPIELLKLMSEYYSLR